MKRPSPRPGFTYAEDLAPGLELALGSHTVTETEIVEFARQWDPHYIHADPARAAVEGRFGGVIASGLHTMSVYQRLWVLGCRQPWRVIAGSGMRDVKFLRPVRPGDQLTAHCVVNEVSLQPERQRARVVYEGRATNQHGEQVLGLTLTAYVEMRPA